MVILWFTSSSAMPPMGYSQVKHVWLNCNPKQGTATMPKQNPEVFTNMSKPLLSGTAWFPSPKQCDRSSVLTYTLFSSAETLSWSTHQRNTLVHPSLLSFPTHNPFCRKGNSYSPCASPSSCFGTRAHSHREIWELSPINHCRNSLLSHSLRHSAGTDSLNLPNNLSCLSTLNTTS